tara:strand:- start:3045 stop:4520 length:1476 start_codon:yes stop_codon:yes gene_type:complete
MEVIINLLFISVALPITWRITSRYYISKISDQKDELSECYEIIENYQTKEELQRGHTVDLEKEIVKLEEKNNIRTEIFNLNQEKNNKSLVEDFIKKIKETKKEDHEIESKDIMEYRASLSLELENNKKSIEDLKNKIDSQHNENKLNLQQQLDQEIEQTKQINVIKSSLDNSQIRGEIGETLMQNIVKNEGFVEGSVPGGYELQKVQEDGKKPDMVIHITDENSVIIDSKFPVDQYNEYSKEEDPKKLKFLEKKVLESVETHVDALSKKKYKTNSYKNVLMFLPNEDLYATAKRADKTNSLDNRARKKGIQIVTPSLLIPILGLLTSQIKQQKHKENVYEELIDLVESVRKILKDQRPLGKKILKLLNKVKELVSVADECSKSYKNTNQILATAEEKGTLPTDKDLINLRKKNQEMSLDQVELEFSKTRIRNGMQRLERNEFISEEKVELSTEDQHSIVVPGEKKVIIEELVDNQEKMNEDLKKIKSRTIY